MLMKNDPQNPSTIFSLEAVGGPWAKRLATRRSGFDEYPWETAAAGASAQALEAGRLVWTQSAFSEVASAASFSAIASAMLAASAPMDLVAAAGDFVAEEMLHAELSARVAAALGGAVALEVDMGRLVRPPTSDKPLVRAAELIVRTSCVGEALTISVLKSARKTAPSALVDAVIARILKDESGHAQLGVWFLDWAAEWLEDEDLAHLGRAAGGALRAYVPLFDASCVQGGAAVGVMDCDSFDAAFEQSLDERVLAPLAERGILIPEDDVTAIRAAMHHEPATQIEAP